MLTKRLACFLLAASLSVYTSECRYHKLRRNDPSAPSLFLNKEEQDMPQENIIENHDEEEEDKDKDKDKDEDSQMFQGEALLQNKHLKFQRCCHACQQTLDDPMLGRRLCHYISSGYSEDETSPFVRCQIGFESGIPASCEVRCQERIYEGGLNSILSSHPELSRPANLRKETEYAKALVGEALEHQIASLCEPAQEELHPIEYFNGCMMAFLQATEVALHAEAKETIEKLYAGKKEGNDPAIFMESTFLIQDSN
jgi:hypothetical protein